jgi:hypothetical protein
VFASIAVAWLAGLDPSTAALFRGAQAFTLLVLAGFGSLLVTHHRRVIPVVALAVAGCPLLVVHLRSGYVDANVGVLAVHAAPAPRSRRDP